MFSRETKHTYVDDAIARLTVQLQNHEPNSKEFGEVLDRLTQLQKIRNDERNAYLNDLPSADTILTVAANLIGVAMILHHEKLDIITTWAKPLKPTKS